MTTTLVLAQFILNNIIEWMRGKEPLNSSKWSQELHKELNKEKQTKVYEQFSKLGDIFSVGEIKNYYSYIYFVELEYPSSNWFLSIKLDENNEVISILLTPNNRVERRDLDVSEGFKETIRQEYFEIDIAKNLSIEASITSSIKNEPKALVVFIHGSGASDKNENMGYCAPFYDLAMGLASKNIASIRFDKRSWTYPFLNIKDPLDEVINDAVSATNLIKEKFKNIEIPLIILGHSQGATFVTQIADKLSFLPNAFILLAAPCSNDLHTRLIDQLDYLIQKDPANYDSLLKMKNEVEESFKNWKIYLQGKVEHTKFIFNYSAEYLTYLASYNPIDEIKKADIPTLILQGRDDYKVLEEIDFNKWKNELDTNTNFNFKLYENLEHCFVKSKNAENHIFDVVNSEVINDITEWILNL